MKEWKGADLLLLLKETGQRKIFTWHFGFTVQVVGRGGGGLQPCVASLLGACGFALMPGGLGLRGPQPSPTGTVTGCRGPCVHHRRRESRKHSGRQNQGTQPESRYPWLGPPRPTYGSRTSRPSTQAGRGSGPSGGRRAPRDGTRSAAGSLPRAVPARTL